MGTLVQKLIHVDAPAVFAAFADQPYALFLDSADQNHPNAQYSFIAFDPVEIITLDQCKKQDPFSYVQSRINHWKEQFQPEHDPALPPFQGGAAGLFGYDLGRTIETLPHTAKASHTPDLAIGIYNQLIAFNHETNEAWHISHSPSDCFSRESGDLLNQLETDSCLREEDNKPSNINWQAQFTESAYKDRVERVIDYIRAGDIFQANLSQRFEAALPTNFDAYAHYLHLRKINAAPFAGYMNLGPKNNNVKISSASPERFLQLKEGHVETKPIKGTTRREDNPATDQLQRMALENSAKDRAENTMIVDLLRNDLSKVCKAGTIKVDALCKLESFARVHHLVSTVSGKLQKDKTPLDLLRACFPGGSITGAPKIRAMEIIEELEEKQRGPYCGSLGYIGFDGTMDSNILIRTLVYKNDTVSFNTGGGITSDSDPQSEYQETLDKAAAIFHSFENKNDVQSKTKIAI